jgi:hypothetical protein
MKYEKMQSYGEGKFRRITGVRRRTFAKMIVILSEAEAIRRAKGGRKPKLSIEDMLLAALEYWREYRTYAHIAVGFDLSESQIYRIVKWVEDVLICDGTFSLPSKRALIGSDIAYEVIQIDATETPVERPKRGRKNGIPGRRKDTQ